MKSAQAILYFFSKFLENMVNIIAWNPSICFCCCCSCWPINFIIASFFAASCCNSCFFSSSSSFLTSSNLSFLSFRYSRVLFPLDLLFLPFPSFSLLPASPLPSFSLPQHLSYLPLPSSSVPLSAVGLDQPHLLRSQVFQALLYLCQFWGANPT